MPWLRVISSACLSTASLTGCGHRRMGMQEDTHGNLQFSCQELTNKKDLIASIAGFQPHVIHFAGDSDTGRLVMPDGAALAMPPFGWRA